MSGEQLDLFDDFERAKPDLEWVTVWVPPNVVSAVPRILQRIRYEGEHVPQRAEPAKVLQFSRQVA